MTFGGARLRVFRVTISRDARVFTSYRFRLLSLIAGPVFMVALFHFVSKLVQTPQFPRAEDYFAYVLVGVLALEIISATVTSAASGVRQELTAGTIEPMVLSPAGPVLALTAGLVFPVVLRSTIALATMSLAIAAFGLDVAWATVPAAAGVAILASVAFASFGVALLGVTIAFKQAAAGATLILSGLALAGGLYFPVSVLPSWLRWVSDVQPLTPAADLLRHFTLGLAAERPVARSFVTLALFAAIALPLSLALLSRFIDLAQRRGTIIEY